MKKRNGEGNGGDDVLILSESVQRPGQNDGTAYEDPGEAVLSELGDGGSGAYVNIYRVPARPGQQEAFLGRWDAAEFTLEDLKARHGGGVYSVRGYRPKRDDEKGPNNKRLFVNRQITIEDARDAKPVSIAPAAGGPVDLVAVFAEIARLQAQGFEKLGQLIVQGRQGEGGEEKFLDRMVRYKTLFSSGDGFSPDKMMGFLSSVVGAASGMKKLVAESPGGAKETNDLDVLMKGMDLFGRPLVDAIVRNQAAGGAAALPAPAAAPAAAAQPKPGAPDMNTVERMLVQRELKKLCERAARGSDPQLWAEVILEEVPRDKLEELLGAADWFERISAIEPACRGYPAWFTDLHTEVSALLTPDAGDGDTDASSSSGAPPVPQPH
jgi:hypothetical protein